MTTSAATRSGPTARRTPGWTPAEGDADLAASYRRCRSLTKDHGKTYYLATRLLPAAKRPSVYALYGLARHADEIVDDLGASTGVADRRARLGGFAEGFLRDLHRGYSAHPVGRAVVDTAVRWSLDRELFEAFFASMEMDLTVTGYPTWAELDTYVHGSAAVIGLQMLPILEPVTDDPRLLDAVSDSARDLGVAFQLANFIRDVGEDLDRGRVYLPLADLQRFGLSRGDLERRVVDDRVRALLSFEVARVHGLRDSAAAGIPLLHPTSRPCIAAALSMYCGIADRVAELDYQVFTRRARVPLPRRLRTAGRAWRDVRAARRRAPAWERVAAVG